MCGKYSQTLGLDEIQSVEYQPIKTNRVNISH